MKLDKSHIEKMIQLAKSYGATRLILFGSAAVKPSEANDIDIACDGVHGWKIYEMAAKIEEEIGAPVDIVPLNPQTSFTQHVLKTGKVLL